MNNPGKRLACLASLSFILTGFAGAQEFYSSLNNYNRILINPAYAGLDYGSNVWTSWSVFAKSKNEVFDEYTLVYDRYSSKLAGGTAFFLKRGLQGGTNINTLELGFSYSPRMRRVEGNFTPSVYFGFQQPVKHWFVYGFDEWRNSFEEFQNTPGKAFLRSGVYKIGGGLLFRAGKSRFGISGSYGFQERIDKKVASSKEPYKLVAHFEKQSYLKSNGILSQTKQISRQLFLHLENGLFQAKAEVMVTGKKFLYSAFLQNNFSDNLQNLGGSAGFENNLLRIVVTGSFGTSPGFDRLAFGSAISLVYKLPTENVKRIFPFKPLNE